MINGMLVHGAGEAVLLGFQHYLLTLGVTVLIPTILVPQMGGGFVSTFFIFLFAFVLLEFRNETECFDQCRKRRHGWFRRFCLFLE